MKRGIISRLREEKHWLLDSTSQNEIHMTKVISGRVITLTLTKTGKGKYHVVFPSYLFESRVSHFAPAEEEYRNCRNRSILLSIIKLLRRSTLWNHLDNRDFVKINDHNDRSNKSRLKKELKELIGV